MHDFFGDAGNLDVHLQSSNTALGTRHFEVHVTQMIFIAQNVGQHCEAVTFFDQAHGNTRNVRFHRNTGIHQCQATAAHRRHGAGTVGLGDFGDQPNRIAKIARFRQHRHQGALGKPAMADFAPLGRTHAAGFAGCIRRHVVVQHEGIRKIALQCVDFLRIARSAECRHYQCLCFAPRKQRRTVGARQHPGANGDRAHGARIAAVDAWLTAENARTHHFCFAFVEQIFHRILLRGVHIAGNEFAAHTVANRIYLRHAHLLLSDAIGVLQRAVGELAYALHQGGVMLHRGPIPRFFAGLFRQFVDRFDHDLHLLVAKHHCAEHHIFRQFFSFGFHHQHGLLGTRHHQVQGGSFKFGLGRVEHVFVVDITNARSAERAAKGHTGNRQGGGRANQSGDIRIDFGVGRHHRRHDLHFVVEAIRKQGTYRTIDQARSQHFFFRRLAFAAEKTARDFTRGIRALLIIDG